MWILGAMLQVACGRTPYDAEVDVVAVDAVYAQLPPEILGPAVAVCVELPGGCLGLRVGLRAAASEAVVSGQLRAEDCAPTSSPGATVLDFVGRVTAQDGTDATDSVVTLDGYVELDDGTRVGLQVDAVPGVCG
jgi:hypothetical protein